MAEQFFFNLANSPKNYFGHSLWLLNFTKNPNRAFKLTTKHKQTIHRIHQEGNGKSCSHIHQQSCFNSTSCSSNFWFSCNAKKVLFERFKRTSQWQQSGETCSLSSMIIVYCVKFDHWCICIETSLRLRCIIVIDKTIYNFPLYKFSASLFIPALQSPLINVLYVHTSGWSRFHDKPQKTSLAYSRIVYCHRKLLVST